VANTTGVPSPMWPTQTDYLIEPEAQTATAAYVSGALMRTAPDVVVGWFTPVH